MDIIGELLEGILGFLTKSSKKKFKGEESDDRFVYETSGKSEDGEDKWNEVKEWKVVDKWNEVSDWNQTSQEKLEDEKNQLYEVNQEEQVNYSSKVGNLGLDNNLLEVYNVKQIGKDGLVRDNQQGSYNNLYYDIEQNKEIYNDEVVSSNLNFNTEALRNSLIYSEILGKPKVKSRRRRKNWI